MRLIHWSWKFGTKLVAPAVAPTETPTEPRRWSLVRFFVFRFAFVYFLLLAVPTLAAYIPREDLLAKLQWDGDPVQYYSRQVDALARWVAPSIFGIDRDLGPPFNGSGDRTIDYIMAFDRAAAALFAALVWSAFSRRHAAYRYLPEILWIVLRYYLSLTMIAYGLAKLIPPLQFSEPQFSKLTQPYGEASPMGLLWTFMGASPAYTNFGGAVETLGGLLLLLRRTTLAGALVSIAVMGNIVAMNFCYDVPVKLYSMHYLLIAIILALANGRRLLDFFVLNRPTAPADLRIPLPPMRPRREMIVRGVLLLLKWGVLAWLAYTIVDGRLGMSARSQSQEADPLDGSYTVETFALNGVELPPLMTDARRWRFVDINTRRFLAIRSMTGNRLIYTVRRDPGKNVLVLQLFDGNAAAEQLAYRPLDSGGLELTGKLAGQTLKVELKKAERSQFLLVNRGFHWVNEFPYNR